MAKVAIFLPFMAGTHALLVYLWVLFMQFSHTSGFGVNELLYFRVISPEEIAYIFSAAPAKDFGGVFTSSYEEIFLIPADPADGCSEFKDQEIIQGQVVLLERGWQHYQTKHTCTFPVGTRWDDDQKVTTKTSFTMGSYFHSGQCFHPGILPTQAAPMDTLVDDAHSQLITLYSNVISE